MGKFNRREAPTWEGRAKASSNAERRRKMELESTLGDDPEDLFHIEIKGCQCQHCAESVLKEWYLNDA